jgi:hypothetical protein
MWCNRFGRVAADFVSKHRGGTVRFPCGDDAIGQPERAGMRSSRGSVLLQARDPLVVPSKQDGAGEVNTDE